MRGEYGAPATPTTSPPELPPRARRIPLHILRKLIKPGTTSACAENTFSFLVNRFPAWNYLRVRGEYKPKCSGSMKNTELPPRARRIRAAIVVGVLGDGTTSACAENTTSYLTPPGRWWNYLRVRGEYWSERHRNDTIMELPPRARRIPGGATGR